MVLQALFVLPLGDLVWGEVEVTRTYGVEITYHIHRSVRHPRVRIWAKAQRAVLLRTALDTYAREGLVADDDLGVGLIILKEDIIPRLMLLDEGVL